MKESDFYNTDCAEQRRPALPVLDLAATRHLGAMIVDLTDGLPIIHAWRDNRSGSCGGAITVPLSGFLFGLNLLEATLLLRCEPPSSPSLNDDLRSWQLAFFIQSQGDDVFSVAAYCTRPKTHGFEFGAVSNKISISPFTGEIELFPFVTDRTQFDRLYGQWLSFVIDALRMTAGGGFWLTECKLRARQREIRARIGLGYPLLYRVLRRRG